MQAIARKFRAIQSRRNRAGVFTKIYKEGLWGSPESLSGTGSGEQATLAIRQELPKLFRSLGVTSMIDIPCGDFHWIGSLVAETGVRYQGFDIVADMIADNQRRYGSPSVHFGVLDIVKMVPPQADLILCRHLLIHLPLQDAVSSIRNFQRSGSKYLLVTTQPDCPRNEEIAWTGTYRPVNLELPPFQLKPTARIPDPQSPTDQAELALFRLDEISL